VKGISLDVTEFSLFLGIKKLEKKPPDWEEALGVPPGPAAAAAGVPNKEAEGFKGGGAE
jgi:hypothetical protein